MRVGAPVGLALLILLWLGWSGAGDATDEDAAESTGAVPSDRVAASLTGEPDRSSSTPTDPAVDSASPGGAAPVEDAAAPQSTESRPAPLGAGPAGEPGGPPTVEAPQIAGGAAEIPAAAVADRLWGCLRRISEAGRGAEFDAAFRALSDAEGLSMSESQRWLLDSGRRKLEDQLQARLLALDAAVRTGAVVEAVDELRILILTEHPWLGKRLVEALQGERGWPDWRVPGAADPPMPAPLARGSRARLLYDGRWTEGVVMASRDDAVTLRVRTPEGDRFPSCLRTTLEPSSPDPALAREQAAAAAMAGDRLLAVGWQLRAAALD